MWNFHKIESDLPQMEQVNCFSTTNELYAALRKNYVDAIAGHEAMLSSLVQDSGGAYRMLKESPYTSEVGVAFQKGTHEKVAADLTETLKEMQDEGITGEIVTKDDKKLNNTLNETFDFVKNRIERYETYNTNDQVKSLVRLMDKTIELSRVIAQEGTLSAEMLDEYAREQRLTGILVLDQKLKVIVQSAEDGDTMPLWQKLIESEYVRDIADHPEKTYTTRLRNDGKIYDFAAVARQDTAGILIAYAQKEEVNELNGDLTMASLFSDFPLEMNGSVVICDDDKIVSTNKQNLAALSIEDSKSQYENEFKADVNGIVCLHSKNGNWYGCQEKIKDYDAYIFFPARQVYLTRNTVSVIYLLLALLLFLIYLVSRNRTEKRSILRDQKRLRVINALGHAYSSISLVNLKTEEIEIVKSSRNMKPDQEGDMLSRAHQDELIRQVISEPFQEAYREFINISTVAKRLEERETLSFTAQTVDERWLTMIIVPQGYDKDGKLCTVLVANRDATEEKEREIEQDKNLRIALAAAEHSKKAKTAFLNNMSHDIRTPMNAIIGFTIVIFTVKDNGSGMSPEFREHVFDSFSREHTVTENGIGGTGLGMAITKNIVDMMGGTILVESEAGKGTKFTVMLECEIAGEKVKQESVPKQREFLKNEKQKISAESQKSYEGKKVLLVEDNELNREIATAIVEELGLDVDIAEDGMDAVNIMSSAAGRKYDLIFMDIQMPKMDGYTATREIRTLNDQKCANIPIIAMTANAFEEDRKKAIKAGMNGHIAKPISADVILENLDQIL